MHKHAGDFPSALEGSAATPAAQLGTITQSKNVPEPGLFGGPEEALAAPKLCTALASTDWPELIAAFARLGPLTAISDNAACRMETFSQCSREPGAGFAGAEGDLVLSSRHQPCCCGVAVSERLADGAQRHSLQLLDAEGRASVKLYAAPGSDEQVFQDLVAEWRGEAPQLRNRRQATQRAMQERPDAAVELAQFRAGWNTLRRLGDLQQLASIHGLTHRQALRLAESRFTQQLPNCSAGELLVRAAQLGLPLHIRACHGSAQHDFRGLVRRVELLGDHLLLSAPGLRLQLREDAVDAVWLLRQPTAIGLRHSLELLDGQGTVLLKLASGQPTGHSEPCGWRELLESLCEPAGAASP